MPGCIRADPMRDDSRGFFARTFCVKEFGPQGSNRRFVQHSISVLSGQGHAARYALSDARRTRSQAGALPERRDLGRDRRSEAGSPTFRQWRGFELSAENQRPALHSRGLRPRLSDAERRRPGELPDFGVLCRRGGAASATTIPPSASDGRCRSASFRTRIGLGRTFRVR